MSQIKSGTEIDLDAALLKQRLPQKTALKAAAAADTGRRKATSGTLIAPWTCTCPASVFCNPQEKCLPVTTRSFLLKKDSFVFKRI